MIIIVIIIITNNNTPVGKRRLNEPLPDAQILEPILELRVRHLHRQAGAGVLCRGVEIESQLAQPLERLRRCGIGILKPAEARNPKKNGMGRKLPITRLGKIWEKSR